MARFLFSLSFNPDTDIPDLTGKVILVTGGNTGLGLETIRQLCKHNPTHIYLGARSETRANAAIESIKKDNPTASPITWLPMDLTSFASIKTAADTFMSKSQRLDLLFNNAGIMAWPPNQTTEGYEIQFGTNHVGHFLLTRLLLPILQKTASEATSDVRVITVSSKAEEFATKGDGGILFDHLKSDMSKYNTWTRYGQSKVANVHFAKALAKRYPSITSVSIHPGPVNTDLVRGPAASYPLIAGLLSFGARWLALDISNGAKSQLWAATAPKEQVENGAFYYPVGKKVEGSANSRNSEVTEKLWEWSEKECVDKGY